MAIEKKPYPIPGVIALIQNPAGELLLIHSTKAPQFWVLPSGKIEAGESFEETLIREVKEETNLEINNPKFINLQESIFDPGVWIHNHYIFIEYTCQTQSTEVSLNHEASDFIWIMPEEALTYPITIYNRNTIEKYISESKEG